MAYFNEPFPDDIALGATGGPRIKVTAVKSGGGARYANKDWTNPQHIFNVSQGIKSLADFEVLRAFWYVTVPDSFPFKDYTNFQVSQSLGVLQLVSGSVYQMFKDETYRTRTWLRKIKKPKPGTVTVWRTRSGSTSVIMPTVDYLTGLVTVSGHASGDTYGWAGDFYVPCYFVGDSMESAKQVGPEHGLFVEWPSIDIEEDILA